MTRSPRVLDAGGSVPESASPFRPLDGPVNRCMRTLLMIISTVTAAAPAFAEKIAVAVSHRFVGPRPSEVISIPFDEVSRLLPKARMFHLSVRDPRARRLAYQVTNYEHDHRGLDYDDLVFTYDFAAGETSATFVIETVAETTAPDAACVYARAVPERYDDFAWENDRIAHRVYGPALNSDLAGRERLRSSGVDIWAKRVAYPIIDRWYAKGHDQFHKDEEGEGLDLYSIGPSRGAGGSGYWDGARLWTSDNYAAARVLANGPRRAVFELTYQPWSAGDLGTVGETKRVTVDCGTNFSAVESRLQIADDALFGIGITMHPTVSRFAAPVVTKGENGRWLSVWEESEHGGLGIAAILAPGAESAGFATEARSTPEGFGNHLLLVKAKSGAPIKYFTGAGWTGSGRFADRQSWEAYVTETAARIDHPLTISIRSAP